MKPDARNAAVYRDFEKLYKLVGLYQGQRHQLLTHTRYIDASFQSLLGDPELETGAIQFDFLMTAVYSGGREIFKGSTPELTMAYLLFCEGVRSLVALRGLTGQELLEWTLLIRTALKDSAQGGNQDLASLLWRNKHHHLKVQIYNALLNVEDIGIQERTELVTELVDESQVEDALSREGLEFSETSFLRKKMNKAERGSLLQSSEDDRWLLPEPQRFLRVTNAMEEEQLTKLRDQLSDAAYSDRAKAIVKFTFSEVEGLRAEMESYDSNHIEFNLLVQTFAILENPSVFSSCNQNLLPSRLENIIQSIIGRFHTGLISFLVRKLVPLKARPECRDFVERISKLIRSALESTENRKLLLESLNSDEASKIALELLAFYPEKEAVSLIDDLIAQRRPRAMMRFLKFSLAKSKDFENFLFSLGHDRLKSLLPAIIELRWTGEEALLVRSLQSRSQDLIAACLPYVGRLRLPPDQILGLFRRLPDSAKAKFLEVWMDEKRFEGMEAFARSILKSEDWRRGNESMSLSLLKYCLLVLKTEALQYFEAFIRKRRWVFWAQFPRERELILTILLGMRNSALKPVLDKIFSEERGLLFQSSELKERLQEIQ